jgi:hypothetical protein
MRIKFYFFLLCCFSVFQLSAQNHFEDVVYLKNGSVIHGMIIENVPNVSLTIKSGENTFVYKIEEITKYTREEKKAKGFGFKPKGFVANYEIGLTDFPKGGNLPMFAIMLVNGYQINQYISIGLGVGAEVSSKSIYNVPVYGDLRAYFTATRFAPFFNIGFGYNAFIQKTGSSTQPVYHTISFPPYYYTTYETTAAQTKIYHGLMFNPAVGGRFAINKKLGVTLSVGYKLLDVVISDNHGLTHAVTLRAGVTF